MGDCCSIIDDLFSIIGVDVNEEPNFIKKEEENMPEEEPITNDPVSHPSHYTHGSIESIDLMEECEGIEAVKHFCICNCHKYLYRHNVKGRDVEDIRKMIWYANKYIELCEKEQKHE